MSSQTSNLAVELAADKDETKRRLNNFERQLMLTGRYFGTRSQQKDIFGLV